MEWTTTTKKALFFAMMHCITQRECYARELKENEGGYEPTTNIWEALTIAETQGPQEIVEIVSAVLAAAACDAIPEPVAVVTDLFMALRYKVKFYDAAPDDVPAEIKTLSKVYAKCLDVAADALQKDMPKEVREKVEDKIYCYE